jgi:leucyl/phenylalanyl-tRNA--protein transferase
MIHWLRNDATFPPIEQALDEPDGLLAAGGDLAPERLLSAYRSCIFPWYSEGQPILWWSPDPRMVLFVDELKVSRSLRRVVDKRCFEIRVDTAFDAVIEACAAPRSEHGGTWITPAMVAAYIRLHRLGYAHSVEAWVGDTLAGGLYGLSIGRMFFGESMFARETDASKVALVHLVEMLKRWDMPLIDCQQDTAHLARMGARPIPRKSFADEVGRLVHSTAPVNVWNAVPIREEKRMDL